MGKRIGERVTLSKLRTPGLQVTISPRSPYWSSVDLDKVKQKFKKIVVCFDDLGFPDFSDFVHQANGIVYQVVIDNMEGKPSDFTQANEKMRQKLGGANFSQDGFTDENGLTYTWHHHQDGKTMQLVPSVVNGSVSHLGGAAIMEKGKLTQQNFKDLFPDPELTRKNFRTICK